MIDAASARRAGGYSGMIAGVRPAPVDRPVVAVEALVVVTIIANIAITFSNTLVRYITNQDFSLAGLSAFSARCRLSDGPEDVL